MCVKRMYPSNNGENFQKSLLPVLEAAASLSSVGLELSALPPNENEDEELVDENPPNPEVIESASGLLKLREEEVGAAPPKTDIMSIKSKIIR